MKMRISTRKKWTISSYLNMQFMEPLSATDSSVDAGWDYVHDCWRPDLVELVQSLAPGMIRWGGCFASYYHWREAVGPASIRKPMLNLCWDGVYSNAVGTKEVVEFCRMAKAEPLMVLNMESDGRMQWAYPKPGEDRLGTVDEAVQWIRYCNDPDDALRISHGDRKPYNIRWWQIGNETSYDEHGYTLEKAVDATLRFAKAAHAADSSLKLIAWGDSGWAERMCEIVGEDVDHIAFHYHYDSDLPDSPLYDTEYRKDPARTWEYMMSTHRLLDRKIQEMRQQVSLYGKRLAMTEGHYALRGRNRCDVLSTWMAGAAYARNHNVIMRNSDVLDIATMADFFGNRWQVNAIMIPTPCREIKPYLQPVGEIMRLFGKHCGECCVDVQVDSGVDAFASVKGSKYYVHVVNTRLNASAPISLYIDDIPVHSMNVFEIAPEDAMMEITELNAGCFEPVMRRLEGNEYVLPPAAVSVIEVTV